MELLNSNNSFLVKPDSLEEMEDVIDKIKSLNRPFKEGIYGNGDASKQIRKIIENII